jgi:hypothetical protein
MCKGSKKDGNRSRKRLSKIQFLEAKEKSKNNVALVRVLITEEPKDHEKLNVGKMIELTGKDTIVPASYAERYALYALDVIDTSDKKEE